MAFINGNNSIVTDGLQILYDPSNEQSINNTATAYNIINSSYSGAMTGLALPTTTPKYLSFDGTDDKILVSGTLTDATYWTFNFWTKDNGAQSATYERLLGMSSFRIEIAEDTTGQLRYYEGAWRTTSVYFGTGWVNMVILRDSSTNKMLIYKNGELVYTSSSTDGRSITGYNIAIGSRYSAGEQWKGFIGCVGIYNRTLSATEISQNYNALKDRFQ